MKISKEFAEWLEQRGKALEFKRKLFDAGGHVSLKSKIYDPEDLDEPLKSEALEYFRKKKEDVING